MKIINIKNNLEELNRLTGIVEEFSRESMVDKKSVFQLNLILEEIITNIVSYGYSDNIDHQITVELDLQKNLLFCSIIDDGLAFDPLLVEKPKLDEGIEDRKIGGLGIHFVKNMIDDISYQRIGKKNILKFTKKIKLEG